jgi:Beta-lactamase
VPHLVDVEQVANPRDRSWYRGHARQGNDADERDGSRPDPAPPRHGPQVADVDITGPEPRDVSHYGLGGPWADGAIVSNARDLAVFFGALLRGQLVPPNLVAKMRTIVPHSHGEGLGIYRLGSPCGRWFYGHTGGTPGYLTFAAGTVDGRRMVVLAVNGVDPSAMETIAGPDLDDLLCRD